MIKIFFATFFIAELIIATAIILKIYQFNNYINQCNTLVLANQGKIQEYFAIFRLLIKYFANNLIKINEIIKLKRQEYLLKFIETSVMYGGILLLKGKYKKTVLAYQLIKEIYEGFQESEL